MLPFFRPLFITNPHLIRWMGLVRRIPSTFILFMLAPADHDTIRYVFPAFRLRLYKCG
jgi:hypothetical protein